MPYFALFFFLFKPAEFESRQSSVQIVVFSRACDLEQVFACFPLGALASVSVILDSCKR